MKMKIFYLITMILFLSCQKEIQIPYPTDEESIPQITIAEGNGEVTSYDEFAHTYHLIDSLIYLRYGHSPDDIRTFEYDKIGRLTQMSQDQSYETYYVYEYDEQGRYAGFIRRYIGTNEFVFRDSVVYNLNNKISEIFTYGDHSQGGIYDLFSIKRFYYDNQNRCIRSEYFSRWTNFERPSWYYLYFWDGDNLVQWQNYDEWENLQYKYLYEYDNNPNYMRNHPYFAGYHLSWSKNNVIKRHPIDYSGRYDDFCFNCVLEHQYNENGLPIFIKTLTAYRPPQTRIVYK